MLYQLQPALCLNKIKLEPQYPTSRQLLGHTNMQALGSFWILACSFTSTERNYNNSINWDFLTATGNCCLASWDNDKDSSVSCSGHIQHHYGILGDFSTWMLIMSLWQSRWSHTDEHSITHPVVNTQWKQWLQPCRPPQLSFHKAPLNLHQIMTALSPRAGAEPILFCRTLRKPAQALTHWYRGTIYYHLNCWLQDENIPVSFPASNILPALQTRCSFVAQQYQK